MRGFDAKAAGPGLQVRPGVRLWAGVLDAGARAALMAEVGQIWAEAPPRHPVTRWGKPMSVAMSAAGPLGWTSDRRGYRYARAQEDGRPWPALPAMLLDLWSAVVPAAAAPDSCLVNLYRDRARMGLHQDRDEADLTQPVVSVSLGDEALFRIGGVERGGPTQSLWLRSGDVLVLEGPSRLAFHGIDRIRAGSSALVPGGGRVNLTLRVAGEPPETPPVPKGAFSERAPGACRGRAPRPPREATARTTALASSAGAPHSHPCLGVPLRRAETRVSDRAIP